MTYCHSRNHKQTVSSRLVYRLLYILQPYRSFLSKLNLKTKKLKKFKFLVFLFKSNISDTLFPAALNTWLTRLSAASFSDIEMGIPFGKKNLKIKKKSKFFFFWSYFLFLLKIIIWWNIAIHCCFILPFPNAE